MTLTQQAQQLITQHFALEPDSQAKRELGLAVDATCGNGHDTLFLLESKFAHVLAFDVQARAIDTTRERCKGALGGGQDLSLIHASHSELPTHLARAMAEYPENAEPSRTKLNCVMFNLGYLPNADKSITTHTHSTLQALSHACAALSAGGIITILCYPGHPSGAHETQAITAYLATLVNTEPFAMIRYNSALASDSTPVLFALIKQ